MRPISLSLSLAALLLGLLVAGPLQADEKANDLLKEVERATKALPSLGADLQVTLITQNLAGRPSQPGSPKQADPGFSQGNEPISFTYTGTVKLRRPNLERIELAPPIRQTIACDGVSLWTLLPSNEYIKNAADPQGKSPSAYGPILMFFAPETTRTAGTIPSASDDPANNFATRYLGKERVFSKAAGGGKESGGAAAAKETASEEFDVVEVRQLHPTLQAIKLYINSDKIVTRVVSETRRGSISTIQEVVLLNLKPRQKFDLAEFVFELPKNARPYSVKPASQR